LRREPLLRFALSLAEKWGYASPRKMLQEMGGDELALWVAWYREKEEQLVEAYEFLKERGTHQKAKIGFETIFKVCEEWAAKHKVRRKRKIKPPKCKPTIFSWFFLPFF